MDVKTKILKALVLALAYVNKSIKAADEKDGEILADGIWHLAAELEYALFLLSIATKRENDRSAWTLGPEIQNKELTPMLDETKDLLMKIRSQMSDNKLLDAYENAFLARKYVLRVQKNLDRQNRG